MKIFYIILLTLFIGFVITIFVAANSAVEYAIADVDE